MKNKIKILFLCTGNSCRSQMAEGWTRAIKGETIEAYSAGIEKHGLNRYAVQVMKEAGIDISHQKSKTMDEIKHIEFDYVVTVCDGAKEKCPFFPAKVKIIHKGFDDPASLTENIKDEGEKLAIFRRVRDEIRKFVEKIPDNLND